MTEVLTPDTYIELTAQRWRMMASAVFFIRQNRNRSRQIAACKLPLVIVAGYFTSFKLLISCKFHANLLRNF